MAIQFARRSRPIRAREGLLAGISLGAFIKSGGLRLTNVVLMNFVIITQCSSGRIQRSLSLKDVNERLALERHVHGKKAKNESRIHWPGEYGIGYSSQTDPSGTHAHRL